MTFYNPSAFTFAVMLPAIIILYLLRQKHQEYQVSSIRLWQAVLRDIEANSPWQKLRKNILMFLQLAAMLLLILALAKPFIETPGGKAGHVILVLDTSMSMQATDTKPSRFEAAKRKASRYIANLKPGTFVTLINMGSDTVIEENMNNDRSGILTRLDGIKVSNGSENRDEAVSLIETMLKQQPAAGVVCFSDRPLYINGAETDFYNLAGDGANFAVAGLSHTVTDSGITVLARIANYTHAAAVIPASLYADGKVFDARTVTAASGDTVSVYWNGVPGGAQLLSCSLDLKDDLEIDNTAWNAVNSIESNKALLVSKGNIFLEKAVSLINGIDLLKAVSPSEIKLKGYDLYIFDGMLPEKLPEDGSILIFNPPAGGPLETGAVVSNLRLRDTGHPLMKYADMGSFGVAYARTLKTPEWGEPVINSDAGTIACAGTMNNTRIMVFGFDLHQSDLPLTTAFPVMMANILDWLVPSRISNIEDILPGKAVDFNLSPKTSKASVITPGGSVFRIAPPFPDRVFDETGEVGKYTLVQETSGGKVRHYFTVNAPVSQESDISATGEAFRPDGKTSRHNAGTGYNLQNMLFWVVLSVLCMEWWVYSHGI